MPSDTSRPESDLGEFREMRAYGRLLQRSVEPSTVYEGGDSTGFVTVLVNGRGRVHDVVIGDGWVRAVGPSALGQALMEAFQAANIAAVAASLENLRNMVDSGDLTREVAEVAEEESRSEPEKTYEEIVQRLEDANRRLDRITEQVEAFQRLTSVSGRSKLLRADLDHGAMTAIVVTAPRRATEMSPFQLAAEAVSLFHAAAPPSV